MTRSLPALVLGFGLAACSSSSRAPSAPSTLSTLSPTISVSIYWGEIVQAGGPSSGRAIVNGPSGISQDVTWSVSGTGCSGASCGTIDAKGIYTAPATVPDPANVTITATSVVDSTKSASKTVTIVLLSGPSHTFVFDHSLSNYADDYTKNSRFVLYDNGAFELQYSNPNVGGVVGRYTQSNGVISFAWEGWSLAGSWAATGTLTGNSLTVNYNQVMQLTDFVDAAYTLQS